MANEQLGSELGAGFGELISRAISGQLERGRREEQNKQAAEVIADIRASEGLATPARDARILASQVGPAQEPTGFQGLLADAGNILAAPFRFPANVGAESVGEPTTSRSPTQGLSELARIFGGVDTPGFKEFSAQITEIQQESAFNRMIPILGSTFGIDEETIKGIGPEGVQTLMEIARLAPSGTNPVKQVPIGPNKDGIMMQQLAFVDPATGKISAPIGVPTEVKVGGTVTRFEDIHGNVTTVFPAGSQPRTEDQARGSALIKRESALSTSRVAVGSMVFGMAFVMDEISDTQDPLGALAKAVGTLRSVGFQATRGIGLIGGFRGFADFLTQFDSDAMKSTGMRDSRLRTVELTLAALRAKIQNPFGSDVSRREIDVALEANKGIFQGAPDQARATMETLVKLMIDGFDREASSIKALGARNADPFDLGSVSARALELFGANRPKPVSDDDVLDRLREGKGVTLGDVRARNARLEREREAARAGQ